MELDWITYIVIFANAVAVQTLLALAVRIIRRIRGDKAMSALTGFTAYLLTFAVFHTAKRIPALFPDPALEYATDVVASMVFYLGVLTFIFFLEYEGAHQARQVRQVPQPAPKQFRFKVTALATGGLGILVPTTLWAQDLIPFAFIYSIPFVMAGSIRFILQFRTLEVVKQHRPVTYYIWGQCLAGFSNLLNAPPILTRLGNAALIANSICVIVGVLMMSHCWQHMPHLSELDWMRKLDHLLIIHTGGSILLYEYAFQETQGDDNITSNLAGAALGGVEKLIKEILSSQEGIQEINVGEKKVHFTHGQTVTAILMSSGESEEFRYRLGRFLLDFENQFKQDLVNWDGDQAPFAKTRELVSLHFT